MTSTADRRAVSAKASSTAYFQRPLWSGAGGTANPGGGAYGADSMWWTSFRYYLP